MNDLETQKAELRRAVRRRLAARDVGELRGESLRACDGALSMPEVSRAGAVLLYVPMQSPEGVPDVCRELDTWPLLHALVCRGVRVALPGVDWDRGELEPRWIPGGVGVDFRGLSRALVVRRHGVPEPPPDSGWEQVGMESISVVVVPGAAFDPTGARLGRGGGFYDRLLRRVRPSACVVGLAYDEQIVGQVPTADHDVSVDAVVTPSSILRPGATEGPGRER